MQLFVEANVDRTIRLSDLAGRAELSLYHFARAFRISAGQTPRAFVEQRRVERAKQLMSSHTVHSQTSPWNAALVRRVD